MLHKTFSTNLKKIELEVCTTCNLRCANCDRSVGHAPSGEYMSLDQIEKFVEESIHLKWNWEYIGLLGGEPTLHPYINDIIEIIGRYKNFNPCCVIEIITNGNGRFVQNVISGLPKWIQIRNSNKDGNPNHFSSYNIAPIDSKQFENVDFSTGCWITQECGMGLTKYGYYPCGAGASVDRVFGFDIGIKSLSDVSPKKMKTLLADLCCLCGHFKDVDPDNPVLEGDRVYEQILSPKWEHAYKKYAKIKPILSLY